MRKLKLILAACTLLLGVSNASAQGWTASEVGVGDFYLYNVGAGDFISNGANWGTHTVVANQGWPVNLTIQDGKYTIGSNSKYSDKHLGYNCYADNGDANQLWIFEPVAGLTNTYKLKTTEGNYASVGAGKYYFTVGSDTGDSRSYWKLVTAANRSDLSSATNLNPIDVSYLINNPDFDENSNGWGSAGRGGNTSQDANMNPCSEKYNTNFDIYQTITDLTNGTYAVKVQGFYREGGFNDAAAKHVAGTESLNATLYANDQEQSLMSIFEEAGKASGGGTKTATGIDGVFPNDMSAASYFFSANLYWNTVYVTVTDGTLKIGIKKSTAVGADWTIFDNFRLQYFGKCTIQEAKNGALIVEYNAALANAQSLATRAMNATAKSSLNGVIDDNDDIDTSTATAEQLQAAITALNNAIVPAQASADIYAEIKFLLDGLKIQDNEFNGDTKYDAGTYTAVSEVYADYYAFEANKLGSVANTDYTKAIVNPGFEFGNTLGWTYEPSNDHGAKSTTDNTYKMEGSEGNYLFNIWSAGHPITQTITNLPKGLYELKAVVANSSDGDPAKVYLIANDTHEGITCNTNAGIGVEGTVKAVVTDAGTLTIGAVGSNNDAERSYSAAGVWWYKVDNFRLTYLGDVVSDEDAAKILASVPTGKMNGDVQTALNTAKTIFENSKTADNYQALQNAIDNANTSIAAYAKAESAIDAAKTIQTNTNVATAAAATTFAEAIAAIETAYNNSTLSNNDANAAATALGVGVSGWRANPNGAAGKYIESAWDNAADFGDYYINTWSIEGENDGSNFVVPFFEYWTGDKNSLSAKTMTATQAGLVPEGIYSISVLARVRQTDNKTKVANGITLQVGEGAAVDMTSGAQVGSSAFYLDTFTATGQADGEGTLTIKINVAGESNISWLSFKDIKYTAVEKATAEDYEALNNAIAVAEDYTLGFEKNEYAPYNNVAALEALAEAKAIDQDAVNAKETVVAATTALTGATWTPNDGGVDAIFNGSFSSDVEGDWGLTGWTRTNGWGQQRNDLPANSGASTKYGYYNQPGSLQYGNAGVYTMPLKANTIYNLTFKYASWEAGSNNGMTVSVLNASDGMEAMSFEANGTKYDVEGAFAIKTLVFVTGEAGNYVLTLGNSGNTVMTDVSITKAASQVLEFADGSVPTYAPGTYPQVKITRTLTNDQWATAIYPFAVSGVDEIAVLNSFEGDVVGFSTASNSVANKPFLMRSTSVDKTEIVLNNVEVAAAAAEDVEKGGLSLKGVYAKTTVDAGENVKNYVLKDNAIWKVVGDGEKAATLNPYRAYFQLAEAASARELTFSVDGQTTNIKGLNAVNNAGFGKLYNLNGQEVKNVRKGIFIQNGKKVVK